MRVVDSGTTAVIMNCLNEFCLDARMYSVDINEECYKRDLEPDTMVRSYRSI